MRFIRALCILLPLSAISGARADTAGVDQAAQNLLDAGAAGLAMALINQEGIYWSVEKGLSDLQLKTPMTTASLMNIASISKTVTAASLMVLVERGALDLDRDINEYLPFRVTNPRHEAGIITARQLLTHSSSIIDREEIYYSTTSYHPGADNPATLGEFLQSYLSRDGAFYNADNFAAYAPGTGTDYSNIGAGLAGYLVERVSGVPLNEFSADQLFRPLGMAKSGWTLTEIETALHARLYQWDGRQHTEVEWYGLVTWPDGGLRTSANELSLFFAAMINGGALGPARIMQKETVDLMFTPQFSKGQVLEGIEDEVGGQQAIAWNYRVTGAGRKILGHSGSDPGVTTFAYFIPETRTGAILLVNTSSDSDDFNDAYRALVRELLAAAPGAITG